jgi:hypothetical protein
MTLDQRVGLYEACQQLSPIHPDYATLPIKEGFNWSSSLGDARFERMYLVVFRSVLRATADLELLYEHDELAHTEAIEEGGLLFYFRGEINERGESLSFCLWESREQARRASGGPSHQAAMELVSQMYESYTLERYDLLKIGGTKGSFVFRAREGVSLRQDTDEPSQPT